VTDLKRVSTFGLMDKDKQSCRDEDQFVNVVRPLEAKDLTTLFEVDFSPLGSNKRQKIRPSVSGETG